MKAERGEAEQLIAELRSAADRGEPTEAILERYSVTAAGRAMIELFNSGDYALMPLALRSDHVHDMRRTGIPGLGVYSGRDEYVGFIREWVEAFPGAQLEVELTFEIPERDVAFGVVHQEVKGGSSELPASFRYAYLAERTPERSTSAFGLDLEAMRDEFAALHGEDPGPIPPIREKSEQRA